MIKLENKNEVGRLCAGRLYIATLKNRRLDIVVCWGRLL